MNVHILRERSVHIGDRFIPYSQYRIYCVDINALAFHRKKGRLYASELKASMRGVETAWNGKEFATPRRSAEPLDPTKSNRRKEALEKLRTYPSYHDLSYPLDQDIKLVDLELLCIFDHEAAGK